MGEEPNAARRTCDDDLFLEGFKPWSHMSEVTAFEPKQRVRQPSVHYERGIRRYRLANAREKFCAKTAVQKQHRTSNELRCFSLLFSPQGFPQSCTRPSRDNQR